MTIPFYKYQGAGNDFILVDQRDQIFLTREDTGPIGRLCDRRFGIGADGLMLLQRSETADFEMVYFNADGRESTLCGNGSRCIVAFARYLGMIGDRCTFLAVDGLHEALFNPETGWVELKMNDVNTCEITPEAIILNTGSPHYVAFVDRLEGLDVAASGKKIRYNDRFREEGINVNFVEPVDGGLKVATYERGVEAETLSCGTGVTAAALAHFLRKPEGFAGRVKILTKGGELEVRFEPRNGGFGNIWLCGPAERVFRGEIGYPPNLFGRIP